MTPHAQWPDNATKLLDNTTIQAALDAQGQRLSARLAGAGEVTLMALMNGGMIPASELAKRLALPLKMDYVHATRYREQRTGQDLKWVRSPESISGVVVLVDDIFDEGETMSQVKSHLLSVGADEVITVAAVIKQHTRGLPREWLDDAALSVPDEYVFGFGMDLDGLWRQLDSIWSVS